MNENNDNKNSAPKQSIFKRPWLRTTAGIVLAATLLAGAIAWKLILTNVSVDTSMVEAPQIAIGPQSPGILQTVFVKPGDTVTSGETVAQVGTEALTAQIDGLVIATDDAPGSLISPGQAVVTMIDPTQLRVVATIDENKGLSSVHVGDPVSFTVDAFGSKQFVGVVDEIEPTADSTSVVFDISDKRPTQKFDVKILYDAAAHPELKNGMSAKVTIYPR